MAAATSKKIPPFKITDRNILNLLKQMDTEQGYKLVNKVISQHVPAAFVEEIEAIGAEEERLEIEKLRKKRNDAIEIAKNLIADTSAKEKSGDVAAE